MTKPKPEWFLAGFLLTVLAAGAGVIWWHRIPPKDAFGRTPQSVAERFVNAVNGKDLALAESYWRNEGIQVLKKKFDLDFGTFCREFIECDSFKLTPVARQKGGTFLVQFVGIKDGKRRAFGLYLEVVEGNWKLVRD